MASKFIKLAVAAAAAAFSLSSAQALVLDFEDLPAGTGIFPGTPVAAGVQQSAPYNGFVFSYWNGSRSNPADVFSACAGCEGSWYYADDALPATSGSWLNPGNTSISTDYHSFPIDAAAVNLSYSITTVAPVFFEGVSILSTSGATSVTLAFYLGGVLQGTSGVLALTENASFEANPVNWTSATFFDAGGLSMPMPGGILTDEIVVEGPQGFWAMDDIIYAPVPEASTYAMMGLGLLGLAAVTRRRKAGK